MDLLLNRGETLPIKGRNVTVTPADVEWLPRMRSYLIGVATTGGTATYGSMKTDLGIPHAINGLGRLLDLLSEDCLRRDEPSLASLVVSSTTGEVGLSFSGDAPSERTLVYKHWRGPRFSWKPIDSR
ncbi:hypothetical protein AB0I34_11150 [Kribbella sp. NPDC050281]|uniref:hypothetical protein n=1 Tax=Kribbella sp. NPDC050281 TaxID=3155515 RepID=UPI0033F61A07